MGTGHVAATASSWPLHKQIALSSRLLWRAKKSSNCNYIEYAAAGEIGNGHDGVDLPTMSKIKPKGAPGSAALNSKLDKITVKEINKVNKAAWI